MFSFSKIFLVSTREIQAKIRNRWFWVTTFFVPLALLLISIAPIFISNTTSPDLAHLGVVDETGLFEGKLKDTDEFKFSFEKTSLDSLKKDYKSKNYTGVLYIPKLNFDKPEGITYYSDNGLSTLPNADLGKQLNSIIQEKQLQALNISKETFDRLNKDVSITEVRINSNHKESKDTGILAFGFAYGLGTFMYFIVVIFGTMIATGVLEEKNNRIVEIVMSSLKPFELMMGKILGLGLVGLIQIGAWLIMLVVASLIGGGILSQTNSNLGQTSASTNSINEILAGLNSLNLGLVLVLFVVYFLLGYLTYAALFAAVGASENTARMNSSGLGIIISLPIILSLLSLSAVIVSPQSGFSIFVSLFPLTSPFTMIARIPFGVPWWQIALSIILEILGFLGTTWLSAKIYRVSILLYGKKASLKEIIKWVRY